MSHPVQAARREAAAILASVALAVGLVWPASAFGQSPENVAVVINENSAASLLVGEHYVKARGIPESNVLRIKTSTEDTIDRDAFLATIQQPIAATLMRQGLQDRILYIVLTKGVPLRVAGTAGQEGTVSSVDSELTLLYRRMTGIDVPAGGRVPNPYFLGDGDIGEAPRFSRRAYDIYLVSRLDGFTPVEATQLVDKSLAPVSEGWVVLHQRGSIAANALADGWLAAAAKRLQDEGHAQVLFDTAKNAPGEAPVLGYYSWGTLDPQLRRRRVGARFVPGALAATYASTSARTFTGPPPDWLPTESPNRLTWFAGASQGLVGDLIREGATGVAGYVAEPTLGGAVRPDILFPAYFAGFNLIESFYLALPALSWQAVIVGDPLCAPFTRAPIARADIDAGLDEATGLPAFFGERRVRVMSAGLDTSEEVAALVVRSDSLQLRGDRAGARQALAQASQAAPDHLELHRQIAALAELDRDHDEAIRRYRRLLELDPNDVMALNNLAYGLAVHRNAPTEAKPMAERAVILSKRHPAVLDTLAWIEHLLGNDAEAAPLAKDAVRGAPESAEVRLHAAIVLGATGDRAAAEHLDEALRLDPSLAARADVQKLRAMLKGR